MSDEFFKNKPVLVTGGTGFVGSHIVEELLHSGARVRVPVHTRAMRLAHNQLELVKADLTLKDDCLRVLNGIEYVIHAAGPVGAAGVGPAAQMSSIVTSLILSSRILETSWMVGVRRLLLFSSSTVYPALTHPVREDEAWAGPCHKSYSGYGWARRCTEKLAEFVAAKSKLDLVIVRPTAVYGPWDNYDVATCHVIPSLVRRAIAKENPFVVWGSGNEVRDFLHVRDLVCGAFLAFQKCAPGDVVNIGCGEEATVRRAVELILSAANHNNAEIIFDAAKPTSIPFRAVDITKARKVLGFEPKMTLRDGLSDTVEWYRANYVQS